MLHKRAEAYRKIAGLLAIAGSTAVIISVLAYSGVLWLSKGHRLSDASQDWGTFGDFVGGLAGTVVALATLIAIAYTLRLQAEELEKTSKELENQTAAAREQTQQLRETEARRVRPLIKVEWLPEHRSFVCRIRNVGLGPAILDRMEIRVYEDLIGEHLVIDRVNAAALWQEALRRILQRTYEPVFSPWSETMRILAVDEPQEFARFRPSLEGDHWSEGLDAMQSAFRLVVHFRSVDGSEWSTTTQLARSAVD